MNWLRIYTTFLIVYVLFVVAFYWRTRSDEIPVEFVHWKVHQAVLQDVKRDQSSVLHVDKEITEQDLQARCPQECLGRGLCALNGKCHCNSGYSGDSCEVIDKESMIESRFPLLGRDFIEEFGCQIQDYHDMAQRELSMWKDGNITKALINEGLEVHHSCIIVQVISNVAYIYAGKRAKNEEVYLHGWTEWRTMFLSMLERIHVPDVEFVLCLAERPVVVRHDSWAVFGFVDSDLHNDIVIPAGHHHIVTKNEKIEMPWANRKQKLFWRGSPTGITPARVISNKMKPLNSYPLLNAMPRVRLARLSQKEETLIDAAFWSTYASDIYPEISEALSDLTKPWFANDECHYKYLIALEGDSSCREFSSLLQYGSVVLRPKHKYREYFHDFLEPNVHYVPISNDLESLGEVIQSLSNEHDRMEAIAKQGRIITKNLMRPQELYCFYWRLFHSYRQLMNFEVVKRKGAVPLAGVVTKE